jgi:DNA replication and repair protein RecF
LKSAEKTFLQLSDNSPEKKDMQIDSLSLINYKNIESCDLIFSPKINCLIGDNGMGKTNILDAIYYLSFCKSHSNTIDSQNIRHEADFFMIKGNYLRNGEGEIISCGLKRRQKKVFRRNNKEYEKLSDHIGLIPLVLISPEDNYLITEGSDERRKFIDGVISQFNRQYLYQLLQYNNALKQRNSLLKLNDDQDINEMLDLWEEQMDVLGRYIYEERQKFIHDFMPVFSSFYGDIAGKNENISLEYTSQYHDNENLRNRMVQTRERDKILGYSTQGIHKDDLDMMLDGFPIKRVGSQGQNKTFLIALKFAQFDFLKRNHQLSPLLLLDDIFDKLDTSRVEKIVQLVSSELFGQIFITDTNREHLEGLIAEMGKESKIFRITNGTIE